MTTLTSASGSILTIDMTYSLSILTINITHCFYATPLIISNINTIASGTSFKSTVNSTLESLLVLTSQLNSIGLSDYNTNYVIEQYAATMHKAIPSSKYSTILSDIYSDLLPIRMICDTCNKEVKECKCSCGCPA